jgi:hypothetical protein
MNWFLHVSRAEVGISTDPASVMRRFMMPIANSVFVFVSILLPASAFSLAPDPTQELASPITQSFWSFPDLTGDIPVSRPIGAVAAPTDLTAISFPIGMNRLAWSGNNEMGTVIYEVWRLQGDTEPFRLIGITKKQVYLDPNVSSGAYYNYKVRAVAPKGASNFSNIAVLYGAS